MSTSSVIEVDQLHKTYRSGWIFRRPFEALRGVSLKVEPGQVFGLLGPNGAGKTTLVNVLLGIVRGSGGVAQLLGRPAGDRTSRRRVGYLPENLRIPRHLTAKTALDYYGGLSGLSRTEIRTRRPSLLELVGLADRARDPVRKYSKGMLQRLGLAQAMLHDPDVLFLDEPTDGLDPVGRSQVRHTLNQLREHGKTVFLNSHLLQEVEMVCDHVAILDRGQLKGIGTIDQLLAKHAEGVELELEIQASAEAIKGLLEPLTVIQKQEMQEGRLQLVVQLLDQTAVDALVDQLRSQGISILRMVRRRMTLEQAFLQILGKTAEPITAEPV